MKRLLLCLYLIAAPAWAQVLSWDASDDPKVIGYKIYYGSAPRDRSVMVDVGLVTSYQFKVTQDTWFVVTAYNSCCESVYSEEVVYRVPGSGGGTGTETNACDCNKDGKVDALDYAMLRKLIGQDKYVKGTLNPKYDENYDIDKDEKIDAVDRTLYKKRCP